MLYVLCITTKKDTFRIINTAYFDTVGLRLYKAYNSYETSTGISAILFNYRWKQGIHT